MRGYTKRAQNELVPVQGNPTSPSATPEQLHASCGSSSTSPPSEPPLPRGARKGDRVGLLAVEQQLAEIG
jgi:hypothetical protein